ncbi:MAG: RDD family protein [Candidatus Limnocylindrales bacterium]
MAQPPEDRRFAPDDANPDVPVGPVPEDQPTIAWTPPELGAIEPGEAAVPEPGEAGPVDPEPDIPASPLISWVPSGTQPADSTPGTPPVSGSPIVGWQVPETTSARSGVDGFVTATVWTRLVAYFIDILLIGIIPAVLSLATTDYAALMREVVDASRAGGTAVVAVPTTLATVLITVVTAGLNFIYFVGFWTGNGRATPGMRGLRMQVVDAVSGRTLSLGAAVRRWVAMGAPLSLLAIVPALQSTAGIAGFLLAVVLLITVTTDTRRQGLHDKWAGSTVIRSTASGAGATAVGCLVLILLIGGVGIVVAVLAAGDVLPQVEPILREMQALR